MKVTVKHVEVRVAGKKLSVSQPFVQYEAPKLTKQSNLIEVKLMSSSSSFWHQKNRCPMETWNPFFYIHTSNNIHHFVLSIIRSFVDPAAGEHLALYEGKSLKLVKYFKTKLKEISSSVLNRRRKRNKIKEKLCAQQPRGVWCQFPAVLWSPGWMKSGCFQSQDIAVRVPATLNCERALNKRVQKGALTQTVHSKDSEYHNCSIWLQPYHNFCEQFTGRKKTLCMSIFTSSLLSMMKQKNNFDDKL